MSFALDPLDIVTALWPLVIPPGLSEEPIGGLCGLGVLRFIGDPDSAPSTSVSVGDSV